MSNFDEYVDLASERLGGAVIYANDEFFAEKENLLRSHKPEWKDNVYTDSGHWMDGWETRRRRTPGFDYCIVRLGLPGLIRGVVVDTSFFRGNFPESCSIEGTDAPLGTPLEELLNPEKTTWVEVLPKSVLKGDCQNPFDVKFSHAVTHIRFNIFPDGGVARLRLYGDVVPDWRRSGGLKNQLDLGAMENGAKVLTCSDMYFGHRHHLIVPGRAANMGDGWETRRRRDSGHDWVIVQLAGSGTLSRVEIDTNHFKGNYPDTCSLEGVFLPNATVEQLVSTSTPWTELLAQQKLQAHTRHFFDQEIAQHSPITHVRLNIYPDGGVSRLRLWGMLDAAARAQASLAQLNTLHPTKAMRELKKCCGSTRWAETLVNARPFTSVESLLQLAKNTWFALAKDDWMEAFDSHPRIGESKAKAKQTQQEQQWSKGEQSGAAQASEQTLTELASVNKQYEARFGHIYLVCATGKSADELLAIARSRLSNTKEAELVIASEEQAKITDIRLRKLLDQ